MTALDLEPGDDVQFTAVISRAPLASVDVDVVASAGATHHHSVTAGWGNAVLAPGLDFGDRRVPWNEDGPLSWRPKAASDVEAGPVVAYSGHTAVAGFAEIRETVAALL